MPGTSAKSRMGTSIAMNTCQRSFVIRRNSSATTAMRPPRAISVLSVILASILSGGQSSPVIASHQGRHPELQTAYDGMEKHHGMNRTTRRALRDLLTTRDACRGNDRV